MMPVMTSSRPLAALKDDVNGWIGGTLAFRADSRNQSWKSSGPPYWAVEEATVAGEDDATGTAAVALWSGMIDGAVAASMITVRVLVAVRPTTSVATLSGTSEPGDHLAGATTVEPQPSPQCLHKRGHR